MLTVIHFEMHKMSYEMKSTSGQNMNTKRKGLCAILHTVRTIDTTTVQHEKFLTTLKIVTFPASEQIQTPLRNTNQRYSPGV